MIRPIKLNIGDTIGVVAPSNPIIGENIEEINRAKEMIEEKGFKIKFSCNLFSNTNEYSATAKAKAEDINNMFDDKNIKMIWCAKGGQNSNSILDYLDYDIIKNIDNYDSTDFPLHRSNVKYMNFILGQIFPGHIIGNKLIFPSGDMFWAKVNAIYQLFQMKFKKKFP